MGPQSGGAGQLAIRPNPGAHIGAVNAALNAVDARLIRHLDTIQTTVVRVQNSAALQQLKNTGLFEFVEINGVAKSARLSNDPLLGQQWHHAIMGTLNAWDITTGDSATIAVIDSGVDPDHPDLAPRLVPGWNFLNNSADTADVLGHGTGVAGTLGAAADNGHGGAGITWDNPIMPLVVLNSEDLALYSDIAAAIIYAADRGVRVINISIGGTTFSQMLQDAVNYAWDRGTIIFACTMNDGASTRYYPASCARVAGVGATDATDTLTSFSNYGYWTDFTAPGAAITTTADGGGYQSAYGTSFASPLAAGVAALILSENPALSPEAVFGLMRVTCVDLGAPGFDPIYGWGRLDAAAAVAAARNWAFTNVAELNVILDSPTCGEELSGQITIQGSVVTTEAVTIELRVDGALIASSADPNFTFLWNGTAGDHTIAIVAYGAAGNAGIAVAEVTVN